LREVFYPVLKFREEKRTFVKVEGDNVDFFREKTCLPGSKSGHHKFRAELRKRKKVCGPGPTRLVSAQNRPSPQSKNKKKTQNRPSRF